MSVKLHLQPGMHFKFNTVEDKTDKSKEKELVDSGTTVDERTKEKAKEVMSTVKSHDSSDEDSPKMDVKHHTDSDSDESTESATSGVADMVINNSKPKTHVLKENGLTLFSMSHKMDISEIQAAREALSHFKDLAPIKKYYSIECFVLEQVWIHFLKEAGFKLKDGSYQIEDATFQPTSGPITQFICKEFTKYFSGQKIDIVQNKECRYIHPQSRYLKLLICFSRIKFTIDELVTEKSDSTTKRSSKIVHESFRESFNFIQKVIELNFNLATRAFRPDTAKDLSTIPYYKELTKKIIDLKSKIDAIIYKIQTLVNDLDEFKSKDVEVMLEEITNLADKFDKDTLGKVPYEFDYDLFPTFVNREGHNKLFIIRNSLKAITVFLKGCLNEI